MDALEAMAKRYSYRGVYTPDPVPREDLTAIMEAALSAPSGCNKQTPLMIAVDDPVMIQKFADMMEKPNIATAPAGICVLSQPIIAYRDRCYAVQDASAAIENALLAITALGYASYWIEGHITDADQIGRHMADLLGVPADINLICYLPVGKPLTEGTRAKKKPLQERYCFNHYVL